MGDPGEVRLGGPADEAALRRLASISSMSGAVAYTLVREPDFFALSRLQGHDPHVGIIDGDDGFVAMGTALRARRFLGGEAVNLAYIADLKVHPDHRSKGLATKLIDFAADGMRREGLCGFGVVLGGNAAMAPILAGTRLRCAHIATIRKHSTYLVRAPGMPPEVSVRSAREDDLPDLAALWQRVQAPRDLARWFDAESLRENLAMTPGIGLSDVLVAERGGRLVGFGAPWDGRPVRQVRLERLSPSLRWLRRLWNPVAGLTGRPRLTADGDVIPYASLLHSCAEEPGDLRALLVEAHRRLAGTPLLYLDVSLDPRDPLAAALKGFVRTAVDFDLVLVIPPGMAPPARYGAGLAAFDLALA